VTRLLVACFLALCACQPLPQPFAEDRPPPGAPILTLKDGAGVWVAPYEPQPEASERMAEALRQAGTPASTNAVNRASWRATPRIDAGTLVWDVHSPEGALVGTASNARSIIALVQDDAPAEVAQSQPVVNVPVVEGAPGDGSRSLTRAMETALRNARLAIDAKAERAWIVAGRVAVARPVSKQQRVQIVWELRKPDGEKVFEVKQENEVPAGQLDGPWGDIAWAVASAAAEAIVPLIEKAGAAQSYPGAPMTNPG
jgi:hypothetical protein